MIEPPTIEIDFDKKCVKCGKAGATRSGLCLNCITKKIGGKMATQEKLIKLTDQEKDALKVDLANKTIEFIHLEDEKKTADEDFNSRLNELWEEIRAMETRIREG